MSNRRTRIIRHLHALVGERHPDSAPQGLRKVAQYLSAQFSSYGWKTTSQHFRAWGKVYRNILAVKNPAGRRLKDESAPLIIGAHYDTVVASPGADDNASALTVLLEAACELQRAAVAHPVWLVAFCLEEQGLLGSQAFVSRL
ncbi:MAG: M28 family peptidase, partial [Nitrospira sp.]